MLRKGLDTLVSIWEYDWIPIGLSILGGLLFGCGPLPGWPPGWHETFLGEGPRNQPLLSMIALEGGKTRMQVIAEYIHIYLDLLKVVGKNDKHIPQMVVKHGDFHVKIRKTIALNKQKSNVWMVKRFFELKYFDGLWRIQPFLFHGKFKGPQTNKSTLPETNIAPLRWYVLGPKRGHFDQTVDVVKGYETSHRSKLENIRRFLACNMYIFKELKISLPLKTDIYRAI